MNTNTNISAVDAAKYGGMMIAGGGLLGLGSGYYEAQGGKIRESVKAYQSLKNQFKNVAKDTFTSEQLKGLNSARKNIFKTIVNAGKENYKSILKQGGLGALVTFAALPGVYGMYFLYTKIIAALTDKHDEAKNAEVEVPEQDVSKTENESEE